jgi:hypothetical protein
LGFAQAEAQRLNRDAFDSSQVRAVEYRVGSNGKDVHDAHPLGRPATISPQPIRATPRSGLALPSRSF